jgi:isochorismate synthase
MQVLDNQAVLYAGGGITKDSIPEREWIETELKCKTVAQVLEND